MIYADRPYQTEANNSIAQLLIERSVNRQLLHMATGTGKTVTFGKLPQRLEDWLARFPANERRVLVIAHREEIIDKTAETLRGLYQGKIVDIEQGDRRASRYSDFVVASIQTLQAVGFRRLLRLVAQMRFRIVVVDEAHHAAAASYRTALAILGFLPRADMSTATNFEAATHDDVVAMERALTHWDAESDKNQLLLGVTATPNRSDAVGLGCVFQETAYSLPVTTAIEQGWLVPIVPWAIESDVDLGGVKMTAGDFNQKQLAIAVNEAKRNALGLAAWREYGDGLPTLGFCVDKAHVATMVQLFQEDGIRAVGITEETPKDVRRSYLRQYSERTIDVVFNCMVLTEGTDLPLTRVILNLRPTKSGSLIEQIVGRGLRPLPGDPVGPGRLEAEAQGVLFQKPDCIVIDVVDVARKCQLATTPVLYGLPPGVMVKGQRLDVVANEVEELLECASRDEVDRAFANGARLTLEQLRAKASSFSMWSVQKSDALGHHRALDWRKVSGDVYRLRYPWGNGGYEELKMSASLLGKWSVVATLETRTDGALHRQDRVLAQGVDTSWQAADIAEAFVMQERRSATRVLAVDAGWKQVPITQRQIEKLAQFGVVPPPRCTAGHASALIDMAIAKRGR